MPQPNRRLLVALGKTHLLRYYDVVHLVFPFYRPKDSDYQHFPTSSFIHFFDVFACRHTLPLHF